MAALARLGSILSLKRTINAFTPKELLCRAITTSDKKNEVKIETSELTTKESSWSSYGFDYKDKDFDRFAAHNIFFFTVSVCLVMGAFIIAYAPDPALKDWARREAYLQLRYREEHGLPPIDCNLIDPSKIVLPTDEELGDTEIII